MFGKKQNKEELYKRLREYIEENYDPDAGDIDEEAVIERKSFKFDEFRSEDFEDDSDDEKQSFIASLSSLFTKKLILRKSNFSGLVGESRSFLEDFEDTLVQSFSETLVQLMKDKKIRGKDLAMRTGITEQHISKMKGDVNYQPKKDTVIALIIGMRLTPEEGADLLERAGYCLSRAQKRDMIFRFFIKERAYDINDVNDALEQQGEKKIPVNW